MERHADDVLKSICDILFAECKDEILFNKWINELKWFDSCSTTYWNISPEAFEEKKWWKLFEIVNNLIPNQTPVHIWEKKIVNVYLNRNEFDETSFTAPVDVQTNELDNSLLDIGEGNLANETSVAEEEIYDDTNEDYYYDSEAEEESRKLGRMEESASRNDGYNY